jgi:hypothetical protein
LGSAVGHILTDVSKLLAVFVITAMTYRPDDAGSKHTTKIYEK